MRRILAIDPTHRGFGFAVFEGSDRLVDYGVKETRRNKTEATLQKVRELIEFYRPDMLVVEDCSARGCRRVVRARELLAKIIEWAMTMNVTTHAVPVAAVRRAFASEGAPTKRQIAAVIAQRFPELSCHLPPPRKPWMSEDARMAIFDALALAMVFVSVPR